LLRNLSIFLAGAIFGIAGLFIGLWAWYQITSWLPYRFPDTRLIPHIETLATANIRDWKGKPISLEKYRRWYVEGSQNSHRIIWGEWDMPDPAKYPLGITLGHRQFAPGSVGMLGGGCSQVHIVYDLTLSRLITAWCNAPE
jgi:hypothetical protein